MSAELADFIIGKCAVKMEPEVTNGFECLRDTRQMSKRDVSTPAEYFDNSAIQQECLEASVDEIHSAAAALITGKDAVKIQLEERFDNVEDIDDTCQNSNEEFNTAAEYSNSSSIEAGHKQIETSVNKTCSPAAAFPKTEETNPPVLKSVQAFKLAVRTKFDQEVEDNRQKSKGDMSISRQAAFNSDPSKLPSVKLESEELEVINGSPTAEASNSDLSIPKSEMCAVRQNAENSSESCQMINFVNCSNKAVADNTDAIYACIFCKQHFETQSTLSSHLSFHYRERPYRCTHCEYAFKSKNNLISHMPSHSTERPYTCGTCNKAFRRKSCLLVHQLSHTKEKPHVCTVCGKGFRVKLDLTSHVASRCAERPYACSLCKKTFTTKLTLIRHRLCHSNNRLFACSECGKSFKARRNLKQHFASHSEERPYRCDSCGNRFKNKFVLDYHVRRVHIKIKNFSCNLCEKSFLKRCELTRHMQCHCDKKSFLCSHCNKAFGAERYLMAHLFRISAKKSFQSKNSNNPLKMNCDLTLHARCESAGKGPSYSCKHCAKVFRTETHLNMHLAKFSKKDHQTCHHCKRTFLTQQFKRHLLIIFSRMRSSCKNCNIDFKTKELFAQHLSAHQDVNLQTCYHCNKMFETRYELEQHLLHENCKNSCSNDGHKKDLEGRLSCPSNLSALRSTDQMPTSASRNTKTIVQTNTGEEVQNNIVHILKMFLPSENTDRRFQGRTYTRVPRHKRMEVSAEKDESSGAFVTAVPGNTEILLEMVVEEG